MKKNIFVCLASFFLLTAYTASTPENRTFPYLVTGNGHGFQVFNQDQNELFGWLDFPYRYLRAPEDITKEGPERRNLIESFRIGLKSSLGQTLWLRDFPLSDSAYLNQSNIIENQFKMTSGYAREYFYSPFGLEKNALITLVHAQPSRKIIADLKLHLGDNPKAPYFWMSPFNVVKLPGESLSQVGELPVFLERGQGEGGILYLPLVADFSLECRLSGSQKNTQPRVGRSGCRAPDLSAWFELNADPQGWAGLMTVYIENPDLAEQEAHEVLAWIANRSARTILDDSIREFESWRKQPKITFQNEAERKLWRQNESVLRMGQVRLPNRYPPNGELRVSNGMILASLAPGWWHTGWVRDAVYAIVSLIQMGHFDEARSALDFFLNAEPVGKFKQYVDGFDYRISVTRYFGSGEEEADYSGKATPNVETDGWGLVLWAAREYVEKSGDKAWLQTSTRDKKVYEVLRDHVARAIESELEVSPRIMKPDSSIWEDHEENAKHFAYTTITAARGLEDFSYLAQVMGESEVARHYAQLAREVRAGLIEAFQVPEGHLHTSVEKDPNVSVDGAVVEAIGLNVLENLQSDVAVKTLQHLEENLRVESGGFKRISGTADYEINEWAFIDLRMATAFQRMGQPEKAEQVVSLITRRASLNNDLIPEMYNSRLKNGPLGKYEGSNPMVGYGAGAFNLYLLQFRHATHQPTGAANK